jgi:hypothetical protein
MTVDPRADAGLPLNDLHIAPFDAPGLDRGRFCTPHMRPVPRSVPVASNGNDLQVSSHAPTTARPARANSQAPGRGRQAYPGPNRRAATTGRLALTSEPTVGVATVSSRLASAMNAFAVVSASPSA